MLGFKKVEAIGDMLKAAGFVGPTREGKARRSWIRGELRASVGPRTTVIEIGRVKFQFKTIDADGIREQLAKL